MAQLQGLLLPILLLVVFYFLLIRPQQKKTKQLNQMRNSLAVGDEIVTIGGIHGKITKIKEDMITIEVGSDKTKMNITKWAVGNVTNKEVEEKK